ncbi:MAG TPA: metallophosphoesterase [Clostridiaceae bacterium]|nr:metallophosphoesterase [Clostridiaceae bacterium]
MLYLYILLALIALLIIYMRFEASALEVNHVRFTKSKKSLRILHLSDIHINRLKVSWKKIRNAIEQEKPDLVIMTGDYIESSKHIPEFLEFLSYIKSNNKFYLCMGNHDHKALNYNNAALMDFISAIESTGVHVVNNNAVHFTKNNSLYSIIGIDDLKAGKPDISKALGAAHPNSKIKIVFSHNPDIVLDLSKEKVDYLFCGHFHGGQIWVPFNLEFNLLRADKLCKMGIRKGMHKVNGIIIYINKGLGNVCVPLRFLSRPEISIYYLP